MLLNCGAGEDTWEAFELQEIKLISPKGNQSFIIIRSNNAETETSILWPPDAQSQAH